MGEGQDEKAAQGLRWATIDVEEAIRQVAQTRWEARLKPDAGFRFRLSSDDYLEPPCDSFPCTLFYTEIILTGMAVIS